MSLQTLNVTGTVSFFEEYLHSYREMSGEERIDKAIKVFLNTSDGKLHYVKTTHIKQVGTRNEAFSSRMQAEITFEAHGGLFNNALDFKKALSKHWSKTYPYNKYGFHATWLRFEHENKKTITFIYAPVRKIILGSVVNGNKLQCHWESMANDSCCLTFESDRKLLFIYFVDNSRVYRLELASNSDLNADILVTKITATFTWVQFLLRHACCVSAAYRLRTGRTKARRAVERLSDVFDDNNIITWERVTNTTSCCDFILGNSSALALLIPNETEEIKDNIKEIKYSVNNILGRFVDQKFQIHYTNLEKEDVNNDLKLTDHIECLQQSLEDFQFIDQDRFMIIWGYAVLLSKGFHVLDQEKIRNGRTFQEKIENYISHPQALSQALALIADKIEDDYFTCIHKSLHFFMSSSSSETVVPLLPQCRMVRRVVCTPTRLIFYPPQPTFENRILREFEPEFALRVSFRDDDFRKLNRIPSTNDAIYQKSVSLILLNGIKMVDRHYRFLACSNSQLRDHAVWMYAKDSSGITSSTIREWMGNLDTIRCVATYVARMGQCFSNTEDSVKIQLEGAEQREIPDIQRNNFCFSDGIGKISMELAEMVCDKTGRQYVHSVYQIRLGGCKGTVALDPTLKGKQILIRKSMTKFESEHDNLEIARYSQPGKLFLNHQAITLISQMGVPDSVFLTLQESVLQDLTDMYFYDNKAAAMLNGRASSSGINFKQMIRCGISLTTEPFFIKMLHAVGRSFLRDLLTRSRIELPHAYARNMLGALDETQTLQSGQVFIRYSANIEEPNEKLVVLKGTVLVTKFPAVHPGDVRKFEAIDVPGLHHMKDCIIFPSLVCICEIGFRIIYVDFLPQSGGKGNYS